MKRRGSKDAQVADAKHETHTQITNVGQTTELPSPRSRTH